MVDAELTFCFFIRQTLHATALLGVRSSTLLSLSDILNFAAL